MTSKAINRFAPESSRANGADGFDHERDTPARWATVVSIADKIGYIPQTLHERVRKAEVAQRAMTVTAIT